MLTLNTRACGLVAIAVAAMALVVANVNAVDDKESEEREISLKEAPEAIRKAFEGVDVDEIEVETEDGQTIYEVTLEIDDVEIELELTAEGKLIGVEVEHEDDDNDAENEDDK